MGRMRKLLIPGVDKSLSCAFISSSWLVAGRSQPGTFGMILDSPGACRPTRVRSEPPHVRGRINNWEIYA